ncbi:hypothetical protein [Bacillus cereus group sp. BfR-BA-01700]|uniref:hypothetical protein n=1 Tax=Bacillus cereus group sp. BfR-BA-01700 TaxID=3094884 RepID=UPI003D17C929
MPKITTRLKLELPLGNEHVKREVLNKAFEDIDKVVMLQEDLNKANQENTKYVDKKFGEAKTYADETAVTKANQALTSANANASTLVNDKVVILQGNIDKVNQENTKYVDKKFGEAKTYTDETATTKANQALTSANANASTLANGALDAAKKYMDDKKGKANEFASLDKDGKVPTTQLPKRNASDINLVDAKGYFTQKNAEAALQQVGDTLKNMQQKLSNYKSSKDTNGIFSIVECKRKDGTLSRKQILSDQDTNGNYLKQTINFYDESGTKIIGTDVYVITYDADGDVISEVLQ